MRHPNTEMTLQEVLSDPLILSVARADGVSATDFKMLLHSVARRFRPEPAPQATGYASPRDWKGVAGLCCA